MKAAFSKPRLGVFVAIAILTGILFGFEITRQQKDAPKEAPVASLLSPRESHIDTAVQTDMGECFTRGMRSDCYLDAAANWYAQFELAEILGALARTEQNRAVFVRCHQTTHYLGRSNFKDAQTIAEAYGRCTPVCHGGCYHGVIEGYFQENNLYSLAPEDDILPQIIPTICGKAEDYASSRLFHECHHGIGHGLMFLTNMSLPVSLKLCDLLPHRQDQEACYSGVFMENSSSSTNTDHFSQYIREDDPLYPCNVLDEQYLSTCYAYQSSHFSIITGQDWAKVIDLCFRIPQDYRKGCFGILGSNQVGFSQDFAAMKQACSLVPDAEMRDSCIGGVANGLGGRYIDEPSYMREFCAMADIANKKMCYQKMGEALWGWGYDAEKKKEVCEGIEDKEYISVCSSGI